MSDKDSTRSATPPPARSDTLMSFSNVSFAKLNDIAENAAWRTQGLEDWFLTHDEMKNVFLYLDAPSITVLARTSKALYERCLYDNDLWRNVIHRDLSVIFVRVVPNVAFPNPFYSHRKGENETERKRNPYEFSGSALFYFDGYEEYDTFHEIWVTSDSKYESDLLVPVNDGVYFRLHPILSTLEECDLETEQGKILQRYIDNQSRNLRVRAPHALYKGGGFSQNETSGETFLPCGEDGFCPGAMRQAYLHVLCFFANPYEASLRGVQIPTKFSEYLFYDEDSTTRIQSALDCVRVDSRDQILTKNRLPNLKVPHYPELYYTTIAAEAHTALTAVKARNEVRTHLVMAMVLPAVGSAVEFLISDLSSVPSELNIMSKVLLAVCRSPTQSMVLPALRQLLPHSPQMQKLTNGTQSSRWALLGVGVFVTAAVAMIQKPLKRYCRPDYTIKTFNPPSKFYYACLDADELLHYAAVNSIAGLVCLGCNAAGCSNKVSTMATAGCFGAAVLMQQLIRLRLVTSEPSSSSASYRCTLLALRTASALASECAGGPFGALLSLFSLQIHSIYVF